MLEPNRQQGFTLIEVVVALGICAIMGGSVAALFQVLDINARSTIHVKLLNEIDSAAHWVTRDAQMAQTVNTSSPSGLPFTLTWTEWDGTANNVTYRIQNGSLRREFSVNGGQPVSTTVARYLSEDTQLTSVNYSSGALFFKVTTVLTGFRSANETRSLRILPRAAME